jgi:hypothetical protein
VRRLAYLREFLIAASRVWHAIHAADFISPLGTSRTIEACLEEDAEDVRPSFKFVSGARWSRETGALCTSRPPETRPTALKSRMLLTLYVCFARFRSLLSLSLVPFMDKVFYALATLRLLLKSGLFKSKLWCGFTHKPHSRVTNALPALYDKLSEVAPPVHQSGIPRVAPNVSPCTHTLLQAVRFAFPAATRSKTRAESTASCSHASELSDASSSDDESPSIDGGFVGALID